MHNLGNPAFKDGKALDLTIFLETTNNKGLKGWQKVANLQYDIFHAHIQNLCWATVTPDQCTPF